MSFGQLLYQLLIFPLEIVIEVVYGLSFIILRSYGWAIFPLSLAVNLLLLPFYKRADSIQREESDRQKQMAPYLSHIKKSFHGDERYMMIQAYYRENKYKPVYALRSRFRFFCRYLFSSPPITFFQIFPLFPAIAFCASLTWELRTSSFRQAVYPSTCFRS